MKLSLGLVPCALIVLAAAAYMCEAQLKPLREAERRAREAERDYDLLMAVDPAFRHHQEGRLAEEREAARAAVIINVRLDAIAAQPELKQQRRDGFEPPGTRVAAGRVRLLHHRRTKSPRR